MEPNTLRSLAVLAIWFGSLRYRVQAMVDRLQLDKEVFIDLLIASR
jgi:hypothetical protein